MAAASVTIDAGVLAVPAVGGTTPEEAHRYVETILDWSLLLDEPWVAIYMSERAAEALLEDGLYPLRDHLRHLFAAHGIHQYDVNTVAQVVDRLLQLTPSFETYFRIRDILADQVSTAPDILQLGSGTKLKSDLARCVVLIAILRAHCKGTSIASHSLILRRAPRRIVGVRALVHDLEHERNDLGAIPVPPAYFEGDVLVCDDFRGLIDCLDEAAILINSTDVLGVEAAIRIALYKSRLTRNQEPDWDDPRGLRIGQRFQATTIGICRGQPVAFAIRALRAIVETLDRLNLLAVHALRTGAGAGNPQRMRGRDGAMRRDIDHEYHLHYWQRQDGEVELASIVVHNDYSIPE